MPKTQIILYKEFDGTVPVLYWLEGLIPKKAANKTTAVIKELAKFGYELRRPHTDTLRDGIRELRTRLRTVNYRILYFFYGRNIAILAIGLTKEGVIPIGDINKAIVMKDAYEKNPSEHSYYFDLNEVRQFNEETKNKLY